MCEHREEMYSSLLKHDSVGAEIGVFGGANARNLLQYSKTLYLIDRWLMPGASAKLVVEHNDRRGSVMSEFAPHIESGRVKVLEMSSEDASYVIPEKSLDWVYIDGNHEYPAALWDLSLYTPLVRVGGIVMLHDFTIKISNGAVIEATKYHVENIRDIVPIGKTSESCGKRLQHPTIALKKTKHVPIAKTWW